MEKSKTYFEQIPVQVVKKIARLEIEEKSEEPSGVARPNSRIERSTADSALPRTNGHAAHRDAV